MNWISSLIQNQFFQSIMTGVVLLIISEYAKIFVFEPIKEYKGIIGKIDNKLKYYAHIITNSGLKDELIQEARKHLRDLSCDLESIYKQVPCPFNYIFLLPCPKQISQAASTLILLSNIAGENGEELKNNERTSEVRKLLKVRNL